MCFTLCVLYITDFHITASAPLTSASRSSFILPRTLQDYLVFSYTHFSSIIYVQKSKPPNIGIIHSRTACQIVCLKLYPVPWPGFEPGLLRNYIPEIPQRRVLTTRRSRRKWFKFISVVHDIQFIKRILTPDVAEAYGRWRDHGWRCYQQYNKKWMKI